MSKMLLSIADVHLLHFQQVPRSLQWLLPLRLQVNTAIMDGQLFLNGLCLCSVLLGLILSLVILLFICTSIRPLKSNIPLILTCHTYFVSFISSLVMLITYCKTLHAIINDWVSHESAYCDLHAYFVYVALGNVFYSLILQAAFRLLRVVFYQKPALRSLKVFSIGMVLQWLVVFLLNLPLLLLDDFQYIPSEYRCQVSYGNTRASLLTLLVEYLIPSNIIFSIYFSIIRYIRRTNHAMIHRQNTFRGDLLVFKQILVILIGVQMLSVPLVVLWILYLSINYLTEFSYQLQGLTVAVSQALIPIVLLLYTPQLRERLICRKRRIQPAPADRWALSPPDKGGRIPATERF